MTRQSEAQSVVSAVSKVGLKTVFLHHFQKAQGSSGQFGSAVCFAKLSSFVVANCQTVRPSGNEESECSEISNNSKRRPKAKLNE